MLLLLSGLALAATPTAGVEWVPLSRADLVWVEDGRSTGTGVGEFDGVVAPGLRAWAGAWLSERVGVTGSLGMARVTSTTWVEDTWRSRHRGVLRPGVDLRVSLLRRGDDRPRPLFLLGVYGDVPSARETSNGFTEEEQLLADEDALIDRTRLGGVGGRIGFGADLRVHEHISVGFLWATTVHRSVLRTSEASTVSAWVGTQAGLTLAFEWPASSEE